MDSHPIALPTTPAPPRRPPIPFVAASVPVAAGVVLWAVTGSLYSLCFAAIGPLMLLASVVDGARAQRRARRVAHSEYDTAWDDAERELTRRHDDERRSRWHRDPDAAECLREPPLRGLEVVGPETRLVVGRGPTASGIRASAGDSERDRDFQRRCATLEDSPICVPLGAGVAVRGRRPVVAAVARALVLQLWLRHGFRHVAVQGDRLEELGLAGFARPSDRRSAALRLGVAVGPDGAPPTADAVLWLLDPHSEVPLGVTTVVDVTEPGRARMRTADGHLDIAVEAVSVAQSEAAARSGEEDDSAGGLPDRVDLGDLPQTSAPDGLAATIGLGENGDTVIDLVQDGPHAIVTGTTGTGKSELLMTWVTALCRSYGPEEVTFVLADFKGGTAFEPLRELRQVAEVITDLDEAEARRGVQSLTAELRRRESVLAAAGARDVREIDMPRLVIVVDEFAALLQEHPQLGAIFTDIAARGRALGMHLIIGTQRASGVIRDALAANCPLRLSFRVSDAADSRAIIGSDAASQIPGGPGSRGLVVVRRPQDDDVETSRVALTGPADLRAAAGQWAHAHGPRSPWLPALPSLLPLENLSTQDGDGAIVIGRADEPAAQSQPLELLSIGTDRGIAVIGAPGTGRTSLLRALARQHSAALWLSSDPEAVWDGVTALARSETTPPRLVLCDELDARLADLPAEYSAQLALLWEQALRICTRTTFVITATRGTGAAARVLDSLPRRALLRMTSRVEHLAAGGDSASFDPHRAPGRARIGDREVQIAWTPPEPLLRSPGTRRRGARRPGWQPTAAVTAIVSSGARSAAEALGAAHPQSTVSLVTDASTVAADPDRPLVLVGESDVWQREWMLWQRVRREGEVLIRAENPADLRQLCGVRELPPYARPHAGRAWSLIDGGGTQRVVLTALEPR